MSEFGPVNPAELLKQLPNPEKLAQEKSARFQKVDEHVFDVVGRLEEKRVKPTMYELLPIVRTELDNLDEPKGETKNNLKGVKQMLEAIQSGTTSLSDPNAQHTLGEYVAGHIKRLQNEKEMSTDEAHRIGVEKNQLFFEQLQAEIAPGEGSQTETENTSSKVELEAFPDYEYHPQEATKIIEGLRDKEVTYADIETFLAAVKTDLSDNDPKLVDAVKKAREFYNRNKTNKKATDRMIVVNNTRGQFKVNWEHAFSRRANAEKGRYHFDPQAPMDQPQSLERQEFIAHQQQAANKDVALAQSAIRKSKGSATLTAEETMAIARHFIQYEKHLAENPGPDKEKDEKTIAAMNELVAKKLEKDLVKTGAKAED